MPTQIRRATSAVRPAPAGRHQARDLDHEIVDLLILLMESFKEHLVAALESAELPLSQGHLLMCLGKPMSMVQLARHMGFDASYITAIVDQLEQRELVNRQPDPCDRRVKRIATTDRGQAAQDEIRNRLYETLPPLTRLTKAERTQLQQLLATATATGEPSALT